MRIFGIDLTSTPSRRKPITWAAGRLTGGSSGTRLAIEAVQELADWAGFEVLFREPGPWVAGLDFPFGLPDQLIADWAVEGGWPIDWAGYVSRAGRFSAHEWRQRMRAEAARRPVGGKYLLRPVDRLARAASPMNVVNPPVGMMFHAGAPRLLAAARSQGIRIPPHLPEGGPARHTEQGDRPERPERIALETYPRLVADFCLGTGAPGTTRGRVTYKGRPGGKRWSAEKRAGEVLERRKHRKRILDVLLGRHSGAGGQSLTQRYGVTVEIPEPLAERLLADAEGDLLDAVLCAVAAAWGYSQRDNPAAPYGIPPGHEQAGWIVDPSMLDRP